MPHSDRDAAPKSRSQNAATWRTILVKTETFTSKSDRNHRFGQLRQAKTPGLIRWSDVKRKRALTNTHDARDWESVWYLAYEVEPEGTVEA